MFKVKVHVEMIYRILFFLFFCSMLKAQNYKPHLYGISYSINFSTQINYNPEIPEDGKFEWNTLTTFGVGAFYTKSFSYKWALSTKISYQGKGYKEIAQIGVIGPNSFYNESSFANKFHYFTLEINPVFYIKRNKILSPYFSSGINTNFLFKEKIGSDIYPINLTYPVEEYSNFNKVTFGLSTAAGLSIKNLLILEAKFQRDLTPVLNKENLRIWNRVFSINIQLNIEQIISEFKNNK